MQIPPNDIVPLMGMATGMVMMVGVAFTIIKVAQSQIGQAIARRLGGKGGQVDQELHQEVMELRDHVAGLEQRLAESEERLDFTERMLAGGKREAEKA